MNEEFPFGTSYLEIKNVISFSQETLLLRLFDMAHIAACAENCCFLPPVIKTLTVKRKDVTAEEKYNIDKEVFDENYKTNLKTAKKLKKYTTNRRDLFDLIRKIYPDFCFNMESKISKEDFEIYKKVKNDFKRFLLRSTPHDPTQFHSEVLRDYKSRLKRIVDTKEFSRACNIEDNFVLSEISNFLTIFSTLPLEEQKAFKKRTFPVEDTKISSIAFLEKVRKDRLARIEKSKKISSLYEKMEPNSSYINPENSEPDDR